MSSRPRRIGTNYRTFDRQRSSPGRSRGTASAPPSTCASPGNHPEAEPEAQPATEILPAPRRRWYIFLYGLAVFLPATITTLLCCAGAYVYLVASSTDVGNSIVVHAPAVLLGCALAAIAGATIVWLFFTWNALWAFARSQTRLNRDMSLAAALLDWAFKRKPRVTFAMFIFLVYEMGIGIVQEFEEYKDDMSEQPLWNLLEGGGPELLVLFQTVGAALEAMAYRDAANHAPRGANAARLIRWHAADISTIPFVVYLALELSWDGVMIREFFDEELEPLVRNPNRMRARACALAGVVKTASDLIDCWLERQ